MATLLRHKMPAVGLCSEFVLPVIRRSGYRQNLLSLEPLPGSPSPMGGPSPNKKEVAISPLSTIVPANESRAEGKVLAAGVGYPPGLRRLRWSFRDPCNLSPYVLFARIGSNQAGFVP